MSQVNKSKKVQENVKDKVTEIRKRPVFTERDIDRRDKHILDFHLFVPEGTQLEEIQSPDCWQHIAYKLAPMSQITVTEKSGKWVALLFVVSCTNLSAVTEVIWHKEIESNTQLSATDEYEVQWINHQDKFGVLRKADKVWVAKGLATSSDAAVVLSGEMQALKGRA